MRRLAAPAALAALAAAGLTSLSTAAAPLPNLRSATAVRGHVVVRFTLGDLAPGRLLVASRPATLNNGKLAAANVLLNEPLRSVKTATGYRARTRHTLPPGRYYTQVSAVLITDCIPHKQCPVRWSNVRRVHIPSP
jgi:hypothetical protein